MAALADLLVQRGGIKYKWLVFLHVQLSGGTGRLGHARSRLDHTSV